jgi:hypothetical protein
VALGVDLLVDHVGADLAGRLESLGDLRDPVPRAFDESWTSSQDFEERDLDRTQADQSPLDRA